VPTRSTMRISIGAAYNYWSCALAPFPAARCYAHHRGG
jgi:hypothetical protein